MKKTPAISLSVLLLLAAVMFQVSSNFAEGLPSGNFEEWVFPTGETVYSVVASNGFVYFTSGDSEGYPSTLYCLDADTGRQVWNHSAAYIYFTVANGRVYIQESTLSNPLAGGGLLCLDALGGAELWRNDLNRHVKAYVNVGDGVYVASVGSVYALDAVTGEIKWEYLVSDDITFQSIFAGEEYVCIVSLVNNNKIISGSGSIYALNASSGQKIWSQRISGYTALESYYSSLSIINGVVIVSQKVPAPIQANSGSLLSFDLQNGTLLWKYSTDDTVSHFTIADGIVYSATNLGSVSAVNLSDGTEVWSYKDESQFGSVFVIDNYLYVSSTTGVSCFSIVDGVRIWSYQASDYNAKPNGNSGVEDLSPTNPTYADGIIYFGWNGPQGWLDTTEHNFYALNAYTGTVIWKNAFSYCIGAAPAIANHTLYIGCSGVTTISPTWIGQGVVIALNLNAMSVAQQNEGIIKVAIVSVVFVTVAALVILIIRKKLYGIVRRPLRAAVSA